MGNKPRIRFKGFTEDWEQRKLIYIFNDFIVPMRDKPKIFSGTTPWTRIEDIEGRYINTSLSGQFVSDETIKSMNLKVIPKGSLIVSASATFGVVAIVNNDLITNQTFIGFVPNKDFDIDFLYSLFEAPTTKNKLLKLSAGSTIFYIARESFENLVLSVPSKVEQIKISKIFKSIDNSITLHQCKLEKLKLTKKALLQKLFPKNGKHIPEIRFKGFTDAWEQRKLNDFVIIRRGLTYKPSDIAENGIRVLRSSNIDEDQFITSNDDVFVNKDAVNIPFAKNGDILITSANGSNRLVGKHTIISDIAENSTVHGGFMLLAESKNPLFTDALLSSNWYKRFINTYVAGGNGAIGNLSKSDLENQTVVVPSEHEQAKIGQWYDNINQLITLHQRKLERLQEVKKGLLQKMFV